MVPYVLGGGGCIDSCQEERGEFYDGGFEGVEIVTRLPSSLLRILALMIAQMTLFFVSTFLYSTKMQVDRYL